LWLKLRGSNLGVSFRRQHPIGPFTLDFYAPSIILAIEVDGGQHATDKERDERRTRYLNAKDVHVLRFWNADIVENIDGVAEKIWLIVRELTPTRSASRSDLPLSGGGIQIATRTQG
jgi:very-short-patch-repair endonuclease